MKTTLLRKGLVIAAVSIFISGYVNAQQMVNLLQNPGINSDLSGWDLEQDSGEGHAILPTGGFGGTGAIQSGYNTRIIQTVDLVAAGWSTDYLDSAPLIRYSDYIKGSGPNTADYYFYRIRLLDQNGNAFYTYDSANDGDIFSTADWQQITKNIMNYGSGLRSIEIRRTGWDGEAEIDQTLGLIMDAAHVSIGNHLLYTNSITGDLAGWNIEENGGDGWKAVSPGFRTSWQNCRKAQIVNLIDLGYTQEQLNSQPEITIWEFMRGFDGPLNGTGYDDTGFLYVELRDGNGNVIDTYDSGTITMDENWQYVGTTLSNYGTGLHSVVVRHGGRDSEGWAGHYGGQHDATQMILNFNSTTNVSNQEDISKLINVFPNPSDANQVVTLSLPDELSGSFEIVVRDITGKEAFAQSIQNYSGSQNLSMSTSGLSAGLYTISINAEDMTATKKLIIK